nr:hypothetical protein [Spirulina major]
MMGSIVIPYGALHTSWLSWQSFLEPILQVYQGPIAVEIFNAIPAFANSLRLTRHKLMIIQLLSKHRPLGT